MHKIPAFVLILGLSGCAGAPLVSNGLSSEPGEPVAEYLPEPTALPPAKPVHRVVRHKAVVHVAAPQDPPADPDEDAADRATKALDREVHRLETVARQATNSICRGC